MKKSFAILQFSHDNPHVPGSLIVTSSPEIPRRHAVISSALPGRSTAHFPEVCRGFGEFYLPVPALVPPSGVCSPEHPSRQGRAGEAETACAEHLFGSLPGGTSHFHPCRLLMESICRNAEGVRHGASRGFITEKQIAWVLSLASCFYKTTGETWTGEALLKHPCTSEQLLLQTCVSDLCGPKWRPTYVCDQETLEKRWMSLFLYSRKAGVWRGCSQLSNSSTGIRYSWYTKAALIWQILWRKPV